MSISNSTISALALLAPPLADAAMAWAIVAIISRFTDNMQRRTALSPTGDPALDLMRAKVAVRADRVGILFGIEHIESLARNILKQPAELHRTALNDVHTMLGSLAGHPLFPKQYQPGAE